MPKLLQKTEDKFKRIVLANIEYQCEIKGISREEQRVLLRCSQPTFNRKRKDPGNFTLNELMRLASRLKISVSKLLENVDEKN